MRHGNLFVSTQVRMCTYDSDPTYEAWKPSWLFPRFWFVSHSDPTYEAWKRGKHIPRGAYEHTPILPMRHGNLIGLTLKEAYKLYSDPTYEAWKLVCFILPSTSLFKSLRSYLWGMETPHSRNPALYARRQLRSYLWGMETGLTRVLFKLLSPYSDPTYEAWKLPCQSTSFSKSAYTPILPMRHGNYSETHTSLKRFVDTPILPMRHGNFGIVVDPLRR